MTQERQQCTLKFKLSLPPPVELTPHYVSVPLDSCMAVRLIRTIPTPRHRLDIMHRNTILSILLRIVDAMLLTGVSLVEMLIIINALVCTSRNQLLVIIDATALPLAVTRMISSTAADSQHPEHAGADAECSC